MNKVLVVGSLNMDMTVKVEKLPKLGETIFGKEYYESCGGKGANQAIAISKLGVETEMIGMVGDDSQGKILIENLNKYNIKNDGIFINDKDVTGRAIITVDENGDNNIIVIPGTNFKLTKEFIEKSIEKIKNNDIIVLQNEIPMETIEYTLGKAKEYGKMTILNPAPAKKLSSKIIEKIDYLVLNETEMEEIFDLKYSDNNYFDNIIKLKKDKNLQNIILTLGDKGSVLFDKMNKITEIPAYKVKAIDTTAAGDSFLGGFIAKLCETKNVEEALKFATAVSAIVVTRKGAQDSIPTREEVENFLVEYK